MEAKRLPSASSIVVMAFRSRRRAFRRASWLGVLAVLLQIVVPALHHPAAAASQLSIFSDAVICTGSGTSVPDKDRGKSHCPICWALQQLAGGFTTPTVPAGPQCSFDAGIANRLTVGVPSLASIPRQAAQPRGPPRLV
jgi:Protein of unknown function (DUF2946)